MSDVHPPPLPVRIAGKLGPLGTIGDILLIRDIAKEMEWLSSLSDPKWGNERTDMFG